MKRIDEIKKALDHCATTRFCLNCPYATDSTPLDCQRNLMKDAIECIERLERASTMHGLYEERILGDCSGCKHRDVPCYAEPCRSCSELMGDSVISYWEWRE